MHIIANFEILLEITNILSTIFNNNTLFKVFNRAYFTNFTLFSTPIYDGMVHIFGAARRVMIVLATGSHFRSSGSRRRASLMREAAAIHCYLLFLCEMIVFRATLRLTPRRLRACAADRRSPAFIGTTAIPQAQTGWSVSRTASLLDLFHRILRVARRENLQPVVANSTSAEIARHYLSSREAGRMPGRQPAASLDERLATTADWYRARHDRLG
ncbi:MAG TPA: hypothetical protein VGC10_10105 [Sphingomonas sp.]